MRRVHRTGSSECSSNRKANRFVNYSFEARKELPGSLRDLFESITQDKISLRRVKGVKHVSAKIVPNPKPWDLVPEKLISQ